MKLLTLGRTLITLLAAGAVLLSLALVTLARQFDVALQLVTTSYAGALMPLRQIDVNTNKLRFHLLASYMHNPALAVAGLHDHPLSIHLDAVRAEMAANDALWLALEHSARGIPQTDLLQLHAAYRSFEQRCVVPSLAAAQARDWRGVVAPVTATLPSYLHFAQRLQDQIENLHAAEQRRSRAILLRQHWLFGGLSALALISIMLAGRLAWRAIARHEAALQHSRQELARARVGLEQKVEWRTRELRGAYRKIKQALHRVQAAKAQLVQDERTTALGSLVAGVAHELNTPIGNALLAVSTLSDLTGQLRRSLDAGMTRSQLYTHLSNADHTCGMIERALGRASGLIESFKQVAADPADERRSRFLLADLVAALLVAWRTEFQRTGCEVRVSIPRGLWLDSYPDSLSHVLNHLVDNSLRHGLADQLHGVLTISANDVNPHLLSITMGDDGVGIEPRLLHRVFDPFFTTRMGQGSGGLGLTITYNIVTAILCGRIAVARNGDHGTLVEITMPKVAPERPARVTGAAEWVPAAASEPA